MSSVYQARDRVLGRQVAIKLLHEQFTGDEAAIERFRREAISVAQVAHENVVTVIECVSDRMPTRAVVLELSWIVPAPVPDGE